MLFSKTIALLPAVALAVSAGNIFGHAATPTAADETTSCIGAINGVRTTNLTKNPGSVAADDTTKTAVLTALTDDAGDGCPDPSEDPSDYGFAYYKYAAGATSYDCPNAVDAWYSELTNYDCVYPPKTDSTTGAVDNFEVLMATISTGVGCAKSSGCTQELLYCYFTPKNADVSNPFDDDVWTAIMKRESICSGSYYSQFAGVATTLLSFTLAWTYMSA